MSIFGPKVKEQLLKFQKYEITEHRIYLKLSLRTKGDNKETLRRIADDELRHYNILKELTEEDLSPNPLLVFVYTLFARIFGLTFAIKLMEKGEERAEKGYKSIAAYIPKAEELLREEFEHEKLLLEMIDEEKIEYVGSMVLGLNDALVELTGALAGFTLALRDVRLIGVAGLITGIAASLSMAASEYLSTKSEKGERDPLKASFYTGVAYIGAVVALVLPFFILNNYYIAILITFFIAIFIVFNFNIFVSIVKDLPFWKTFLEMILISLGVALFSFFIGYVARIIFKVEV